MERVVGQELRVLLGQFLVDFHSEVVRVRQFHYVRSQFLDKLAKSGLNSNC